MRILLQPTLTEPQHKKMIIVNFEESNQHVQAE